jgi:hypothetical protein
MPGVAEVEAATLQRIDELCREIAKKRDEVVARVNKVISELPGFVGDQVRDLLKRFQKADRAVWSDLRFVIGHMGSPAALWRCADAWSAQLAGPMSGLVGFTDIAYVKADDSWFGSGFDAYSHTREQQGRALGALATLVNGIGTELSAVASKILLFWGTLVHGLTSYLAAGVSASVMAATGVGVPAALATLLVGAAALAGDLFMGTKILQGGCSEANTALNQKLHDNAGFAPDTGLWPTSTTTFDDRTGWHVRPDAPSK